MAEKTITELNLNSITISNSNYANSQGFTPEENTLITSIDGSLLLNGSKVSSSSSSKIISLIEVPQTVVVDTPLVLNLELFYYNFVCTAESLCTITYVADGSSIFVQNIVFNELDNNLAITLNNNSAYDLTMTKLLINLYTP